MQPFPNESSFTLAPVQYFRNSNPSRFASVFQNGNLLLRHFVSGGFAWILAGCLLFIDNGHSKQGLSRSKIFQGEHP
jgi:hypothetical protein